MVGLPSKKYVSLAHKVLSESDRPLNTIEIIERMMSIISEGGAKRKNFPLGNGQLASHMQRSGLFLSIGTELHLSGCGSQSPITLLKAKNLTDVAIKWLSYENPIRRYNKLPTVLRKEIDKIKEEMK